MRGFSLFFSSYGLRSDRPETTDVQTVPLSNPKKPVD